MYVILKYTIWPSKQGISQGLQCNVWPFVFNSNKIGSSSDSDQQSENKSLNKE